MPILSHNVMTCEGKGEYVLKKYNWLKKKKEHAFGKRQFAAKIQLPRQAVKYKQKQGKNGEGRHCYAFTCFFFLPFYSSFAVINSK